MLDKLQSLSDEDLHRPYSYYQPKTSQTQPIILWIQGNTYEHYEAHQPWIAAIVKGKWPRYLAQYSVQLTIRSDVGRDLSHPYDKSEAFNVGDDASESNLQLTSKFTP